MIRVMVLYLCFALPVLASPVERDEPAFRTALAAWLNGDEAAALPAFAVLAWAGNTEAQILLARIDTGDMWQGDWLRSQSRAARIALMRRTGGLSGQSWMEVAAPNAPRAALWSRLGSVEAAPGIIAEFLAHGEPAAAGMAARMLARRAVTGFAGAGPLPEALAPFAAADGTPGPDGLPDLSDHPMINALCARFCSAEADVCARDVYSSIGGYLGTLSLGPPSEVITPMASFADSPMGLATTRRAMRGPDLKAVPACMTQD